MKGVFRFQIHRQASVYFFRPDNHLIFCAIWGQVRHIALNNHRLPSDTSKPAISLLFVGLVAYNDNFLGHGKFVTHPLRQVHSTTEMKSV